MFSRACHLKSQPSRRKTRENKARENLMEVSNKFSNHHRLIALVVTLTLYTEDHFIRTWCGSIMPRGIIESLLTLGNFYRGV